MYHKKHGGYAMKFDMKTNWMEIGCSGKHYVKWEPISRGKGRVNETRVNGYMPQGLTQFTMKNRQNGCVFETKEN